MSQCSFTEFCNELARVLDTCIITPYQKRAQSPLCPNPLRPRKKMKRMRQHHHHHQNLQTNLWRPSLRRTRRLSAQSAQIKDLRLKLDQAVAENSQIRELLSPAMLTTAFSNTLSATKTSFTNQVGNRGNQQFAPKPFLGKYRPSKLAAGKDGTTKPQSDLPILQGHRALTRKLCSFRSQEQVRGWTRKERRRRV